MCHVSCFLPLKAGANVANVSNGLNTYMSNLTFQTSCVAVARRRRLN